MEQTKDVYVRSKTALTALKKHLAEKIANTEAVLRTMTKEEHEQLGQYQIGYVEGLKESLANVESLLPFE